MKTLSKYMLLGVVATGLWSCSSEESVSEPEASGRTVHITVNVSREGDAATRTQMSDEGADLGCVWTEGDKLLVTDASGAKKGVLNLTEINAENPSMATFNGQLDDVTIVDGKSALNFMYLGTKWDATAAIAENKYVADYSQQDGSLKSLTDKDMLAKSETVTAFEDKDGKCRVYVESLNLKRQISFARFKLDQLPDGVTLGPGTSVTVSDINSTANLATTDLTPTYGAGSVTITPTEEGNEFYMVLLPTTDTPTIKFTVSANGYSYTATKAATAPIAAEKYYRHQNGSEFEGIAVTDWEVIAPVDHSKNPLLKWDTNNLSGLYQWGRNHSFKDWNDARGELTISGPYGYYYWNYAAVTDVSSSSTEIHSGTGIHIVGNSFVQESFLMPENAQDIRDFPEMYIMNAKLRNNNGDYWIFSGGGSNWAERAKACGYSEESPCPTGWRLPTEKDFMEIIPTKTFESANQYLSTLINNYSELKRYSVIENGKEIEISYAICWINSDNCMTIKALVVDNDFKEEDLTSIDWSDENVVEREFPYTGKIAGYIGRKYLQGAYEYMARPMPLGVYITSVKSVSTYDETASVATMSIKTNVNDSFGGYWMSDAKKAFKFVDNMKYENLVSGQSSFLGIDIVDAHDALAIRCVKDENAK